ncbi:MAG: DUF58 domain-containing protein [Acidimicrobiia bacterium]
MTTRGASVVGSGLSLLLAWVVLGEIELLAAGAALLTGVIGALFLTHAIRPQIRISRQLEPSMVHEGERAAVALQIENQRQFPAFSLTVEDGVSGLGTAHFQIASLPGEAIASASYQIVCRPRGIYTVGPAEVEVRDPFGFANKKSRHGVDDRLIVYPAVEAFSGFPNVRGRDPATSASRPEHSGRGGEDFYTLRSYQEGDDLRRVHWPSTARLDELMIRQMETPWQSRALVFFDVRKRSYATADDFERAVRGVASVSVHLARSFAADLWMGAGLVDLAQAQNAFEELAKVQPHPAIDLRAVASRLRRSGKGGALILVTGTPDEDLLAVLRLLEGQFRAGVLLAASDHPGPLLQSFQRLAVKTLVAGSGHKWAPAWTQAFGQPGVRTWAPASAF